ncbi:MAG TPA: hypothetical protein PKK50_02370 [Myxococcota bacterium]|nr:hypothetical protein [Myxococcota bacterium]
MKTRTTIASLGLTLLLALPIAAPATARDLDPLLVWGVSAVSDIPASQLEKVASWLPGEIERATGRYVLEDDLIDEGIDLAMDNGECRENNLACVVEVARALNVPEAVSGDLGQVGDILILTLRRIDASDGSVIKQVTAQTNQGVDMLVASMSDMVATLFDIPHNQVGTVRTSGRADGYNYLVITYGPSFAWVEPVVWVNYYPWWWAGPVRYYHHHHVWWGWHHRHPHGRPHYAGPRRPYPHRDYSDRRPGRRDNDGRRDDGRRDRDNFSAGASGRANQDSGHRMDGDSRQDVRPMHKPNGQGLDTGTRLDSPARAVDRDGFRPVRNDNAVRPGYMAPAPNNVVNRPQPEINRNVRPQTPNIRQNQARPQNDRPANVRTDSSRATPTFNRPATATERPSFGNASGGSGQGGKKKSSSSSSSSSSSGSSVGSPSKSKPSFGPGIGGGGRRGGAPSRSRH